MTLNQSMALLDSEVKTTPSQVNWERQIVNKTERYEDLGCDSKINYLRSVICSVPVAVWRYLSSRFASDRLSSCPSRSQLIRASVRPWDWHGRMAMSFTISVWFWCPYRITGGGEDGDAKRERNQSKSANT